ncbi:MAG: serine hydrolase domain-containing protein [Bacteroidales bacterium]|jgi:CubicO group peptidase (beta-lactamase class C family)|nr:serine hydrolase domain-containing protein [Bacteroidales bacterium]
MKRLIPFILVILAGCNQQAPDSVEGSLPGHPYAIPRFDDSTSFSTLEKAFPVIDRLFVTYAERNHLPSISYGIIAGGRLVHSLSIGTANIEKGIPSSERTLYRIASMSKSFTAMAILKLRDEGKLSLRDPVEKCIGEMANAGRLTADASPVTILDLMTMSSGLPEDNPWADRQLDDTDEELLEVLRKGLSWSNVPGVNYEYSNLGFAMLGRIITLVSGKPFQKYITENILRPLGMNDTGYEYGDMHEEQLAPGYQWSNGTWNGVPLLHDGSYGSIGGMISSVEDFSRYVALHLDAWPPRDDAENGPVRRSTIREMQQPWRFSSLASTARDGRGEPCPNVTGYGYGLAWRKDCRGIVRIGHSGGLPGFGSAWQIYPDYGIGIVSFANNTYAGTTNINTIALDSLVAVGNLRPRALATSSILRQRLEEIIEILPGWKEEQTAIFADNFFQDESVEIRRATAQRIFDEAGQVIRIHEPVPLNQLRGSVIIECERRNIRVSITLNPEREALIQQLDIRSTARQD